MPHKYYSQRTGTNPNLEGLPLEDTIDLFSRVYNQLETDGYFDEAFGYWCVDQDHVEGNVKDIDFEDFEFPFGFLGTEEYEILLRDVGFIVKRVELLPKDMAHIGKSGFEGWIRTTWLPYTQQVPKELTEEFIEAISNRYLEEVPITSDGKVHVAMVRIEIEAEKIA